MTRETAKIKVEMLDSYLSHACQDIWRTCHEAMMMAIKALEQEKPMENFESVKDHILKLASDYKCWDNRLTHDEALELCHILEQKYCEDCVSRKAVLDTLNKMDSVLDEDRTVETYKELLTACYNDLPSVTPEHKKEWIPCSERLPKEEGLYLVSVKNEHDRRYSKTCWFHGDDNWFARQDVVAWMPLPEPYKAESEEK